MPTNQVNLNKSVSLKHVLDHHIYILCRLLSVTIKPFDINSTQPLISILTSLMSINNEGARKSGCKTNNSQSAGMMRGMSRTPFTSLSVPQSMKLIKVLLETDSQNLMKSETILGVSGEDSIIGPFQDSEGGEENNLGSVLISSLREFRE